MSDFKTGDKIICVDDHDFVGYLKRDKVYTVAWVQGIDVALDGTDYTYKSWHFKPYPPPHTSEGNENE